MGGSCGHSGNHSQKDRAASMPHRLILPAVRHYTGAVLWGQCDTLGGETCPHRSGPGISAVAPWPPHKGAQSPLTHTRPTQYWGCLVPSLQFSGPAESGGMGQGGAGVMAKPKRWGSGGAVVPGPPSGTRAPLTSSASLSHLHIFSPF